MIAGKSNPSISVQWKIVGTFFEFLSIMSLKTVAWCIAWNTNEPEMTVLWTEVRWWILVGSFICVPLWLLLVSVRLYIIGGKPMRCGYGQCACQCEWNGNVSLKFPSHSSPPPVLNTIWSLDGEPSTTTLWTKLMHRCIALEAFSALLIELSKERLLESVTAAVVVRPVKQ